MNRFSYIELAILRMLAGHNLHGYAMTARMQEVSDGNLSLPAGSLYPALHKLERARLVASMVDRSDGRRRRVYMLTEQGQVVLQQEISSWQVMVKAMEVLLGTV